MKLNKFIKYFKTSNKGFTLIELGIVLLVSSIIMATTMPIYMQKRIQTGVERTAAEISNILSASKSYYMDAYYNPDDYPAYARWPKSVQELKTKNFLSPDFPESNPFKISGNNYNISENNNRIILNTNMPDTASANYLASILPGGRAVGTGVEAEIHIPGSSPDLDNLLHRDAASTDEQRTMHANIIMSSEFNENTRIVDSKYPYKGDSEDINKHAGYDVNLDEESHLEDIRIYSEVSVGKKSDQDTRIFYQDPNNTNPDYAMVDLPNEAGLAGGNLSSTNYNHTMSVFETAADKFLFTNKDVNNPKGGFIESAHGLYGSSLRRMSFYLKDPNANFADRRDDLQIDDQMWGDYKFVAGLRRLEDLKGINTGIIGKEINDDYYAFVLPDGTVFVKDSAYENTETGSMVGAFKNMQGMGIRQGGDYIDIKRGLVQQIAIVSDNAMIPIPKCPAGSTPQLYTAISTFSEGAKGIDFPISDFRTRVTRLANNWRINIEPSRAFFSSTPIIPGPPSDNGTTVYGGELYMSEVRLDNGQVLSEVLRILNIIENSYQVAGGTQPNPTPGGGIPEVEEKMQPGHGDYTVLAIAVCR